MSNLQQRCAFTSARSPIPEAMWPERNDSGISLDSAHLAIGIVGALVGSWLLPRVGVRIGTGVVGQIIVATMGAILVLLGIAVTV